MTILDNYLKAVRSYLPQAQKDDIIGELRENIRSQVEDKESELGRPLNDVEMQAILKGHGHPLVVAGRYRQEEGSFTFGKQLIGPALFPFYTKVLSFNLGVTSIVILIIFTALIAVGQPVSLLNGLPSVFFYQLTIQFGVITLIFATVDRPWASSGSLGPLAFQAGFLSEFRRRTGCASRATRPIPFDVNCIAASHRVAALDPTDSLLDSWTGCCVSETRAGVASPLSPRGSSGTGGNAASRYKSGSPGLGQIAVHDEGSGTDAATVAMWIYLFKRWTVGGGGKPKPSRRKPCNARDYQQIFLLRPAAGRSNLCRSIASQTSAICRRG